MSKNIKGITVEIEGDVSPLEKALSGVNKTSRGLQSELREIDRLLKLDPKNTDLIAQRQVLLKEAISNTKDKLETLKIAQEQAAEAFAKGEISEAQYRALTREVAKTEQELARLEEQLKKNKRSLAELGQAFKDTGEKMKGVGTTLTKNVTAPILATGAAVVALGNEFDSAYDKIRIGTGATGDALEGLKDDFRAVAKEVPSSFNEVSTAISDYNTRLGLTGEELQELSIKTLNLVRLTGGDLPTAIEKNSQTFQAFNIPAQQYGESLDFIFKVSQSTGIATERLQDGLVKYAPILKTLNLDFEESATLMGFMEKAGVDVDQALSGLNKAVANLAKEGVTDANKALEILFDRIKKAPSDMEAANIAMEIFGTKAGPAMAKNIREGKLEYADLMDQLKNSKETINGVAEETDDWAENLQKLKNNIFLALEPIAGKLFDAINDLIPTIKSVADSVANIATAFANMSPEMQKAILIFAGIAVALGPFLVVAGQIVSVIGSIITAVAKAGGMMAILGKAVAFLTGPIGLTVAAIAALAAGFIYAYNTSEDFRKIVNGAFKAVQDFAQKALSALSKFVGEKLKEIQQFWQDNGAQITQAVQNAMTIISTIIKTVMPVILFIVEQVWGNIKGVINGALNVIMGLVKVFAGLLTGDFSKMWEGIRQIFSGAIELIWNGFQLFVFGKMIKAAGALITGLKNIFTSGMKTVIEIITAPFRNLATTMHSYGKNMLQALWNGMKSVFTSLKNWFDKNVVALIQKLNPFARFSPSLVDNVKAGLRVIEQAYRGLKIPQYNLSAIAPPTAALSGTHGSFSGKLDINLTGVPAGTDPQAMARMVAAALKDPSVRREIDVANFENFNVNVRPLGAI